MTTIFIATLLATLLAAVASTVVAVSQGKITSRKASLEFIRATRMNNEKLKEYALIYDVDNSRGIDALELYKLGQQMEESLGEDVFGIMVTRTIMDREREGLNSEAWDRFRKSHLLNGMTVSRRTIYRRAIQESRLMEDIIINMLRTVEGGDRSEEPSSI